MKRNQLLEDLDLSKIPEGPKLIQALGDELAEKVFPNSSTKHERNAKDLMAYILSDPNNPDDNEFGFEKSTFPRAFKRAGIKPEFVEKHQAEIVRIAEKSPKNKANTEDVSMDQFKFQYPSTAFKNKAAELLDAMEIDMLDNFNDYEDWEENGMSSPNREVEDLTNELYKLDPTKGAEVDDWMENVALPYIKKNNNVNEGIFTRTRLMELAGLKNNNKRILRK